MPKAKPAYPRRKRTTREVYVAGLLAFLESSPEKYELVGDQVHISMPMTVFVYRTLKIAQLAGRSCRDSRLAHDGRIINEPAFAFMNVHLGRTFDAVEELSLYSPNKHAKAFVKVERERAGVGPRTVN